MIKKLEINVSGLEQAGKRFAEAWHKAEKFEDQSNSQEFLTFSRLEDLWKILTPRRLELLKLLHSEGFMSIRALSKLLERDYSNVHTDVQDLLDCGLIEKNEDDKIFVPWDEVIAHFPLSVSKNPNQPIKRSLKVERKSKNKNPPKKTNHGGNSVQNRKAG